MAPRILPRAEHNVSRKDIDPDALKVLYRLKNSGFLGYLVGGGVRDLLLERKPKDFDISTTAPPQQVKKLFRNCFIIGRRFRLCHVRFGRKVIEVSTFRRQAEPEEGETLIRRDNTFGTPEEDAFRRDFTVNALFYDIATFSVIDYVGGLEDIRDKVIRTIGDPAMRFREDPVRMLRAVSQASRLGFSIDPDSVDAIRALRGEIVKSSPARILEEFYKVLRAGASRETFGLLHALGLLAYLLPEADRAITEGGDRLLGSLARLDEYRAAGHGAAEDLTNSLLMGTLLVPLGIPLRRAVPPPSRGRRREVVEEEVDPELIEPEPDDVSAEMAVLETAEEVAPLAGPPVPLALPFARRDLDRLRLILAAQNRLRELHTAPGVKRILAGRGYFEEALRWLEIHGGAEGRELAIHWRGLEPGAAPAAAATEGEGEGESEGEDRPTSSVPRDDPGRRRRRRRRRRRPSTPSSPA
jgi:hypothetical protein